MGRRIQFRRGTEADRKQTVLANGEPGFSPEEKQFFIGDGVSRGGIPTMMAHFKIINTPSTAVLGGRHLFTTITTLQLEDNQPEGASLTVLLDESAGATKESPAKVLAPQGKTIAKGSSAGTEYQMSKSGIERTLIFRNGGWAL
ncbi:hypothetical protein [Pseudoalteromonas denitrificans]|uniref:Major tropism determinant N-terminal domain-containing protein n=1 Tax=Pseudoalteromonas denitrificans DSM 6059 TaxID=1123010 RepID=A0A1I1Q4Y0_9GAMM|nr:hypothetical protein [Pseudoalteromonas denitrificans]SFD17022.1 hypothetical protein SAMN02745724_03737 [Pseudoalteromonas denitrificans DSM 6059]